jgi:PAS domain S-box-containing protein
VVDRLHILNLEDNPIDAELNKHALHESGISCEFTLVDTREGFLQAISRGGIDLILADYTLPAFDGLSALDLAQEICPAIPVIFVTGTLGEETAIEALKRGATDYVIKESLSRLAPAVRRALQEKAERLERQRAEQALVESENTLRSIFTAAPTGIGVTQKRVLLQANERLLKMVGYSGEELIGQSARILYPTEEDYQSVGRQVNGQLRISGTSEIETCWVCRDGTLIDVLLNMALIDSTDPQGGITFTALDITERKKAEETLRRTERRLKELIHKTSEFICEMDVSGIIRNVSPSAEQILGVLPEAVVGHHLREYIKETEQQKVMERFLESVREGRSGTFEFVGRKPDGSEIFGELRYLVEKEDNQMTGIFGVIRDVTERHKMQAQIQQTQKMEAIGTLAGGIAHDFNNILGAIIGYTQLTQYDLPEESSALYNLKQVLHAADRAKDLITQILTFSRQSELQKIPIQVIPVVKDVLKLMRASLPKSIDIRKTRNLKEDLILGDPTQIHQILMNLCTNAAQAMPEQRGVIEIRLDEIQLDNRSPSIFPELKPGSYLRISVSDNGVGMKTEILNRIFDPFFTTKKPGEGTGLGLSVVHGIVKNHGGEITVYSEPGKGSTFRVYLPMIKEAALAQEKTTIDFPGGHERLLFVDDEPGLVETWTQLLVRLGYQVTSRQNSGEALELFRANPDQFDLVITDQTMPEMNGTELARELLRIRPKVPIILCSGFNDPITSETAREIGIRDYFTKPLLFEEIAVAIRRNLERTDG